MLFSPSLHPFVPGRAARRATNGWFGGHRAPLPYPFQSNARVRAALVADDESFDIPAAACAASFPSSEPFRAAGKPANGPFDGAKAARKPCNDPFVRTRAAFRASDQWNDIVQPAGRVSFDSFGSSNAAWTTSVQSSARPGRALE